MNFTIEYLSGMSLDTRVSELFKMVASMNMLDRFSIVDLHLTFENLCLKFYCIGPETEMPINLPINWRSAWMFTLNQSDGKCMRNFIVNIFFNHKIEEYEPESIFSTSFRRKYCENEKIHKYPYIYSDFNDVCMTRPSNMSRQACIMWDNTLIDNFSFNANRRKRAHEQRAFIIKLHEEGIIDQFTYDDLENDYLEEKYHELYVLNLTLR